MITLFEMFNTNKESFWRIKKLESKNQKVNIGKLKQEYLKIFTESNCTSQQLSEKQAKIDEFKLKNSKKKFNQETPEGSIQAMLLQRAQFRRC